jgi:hypothetical protein
VLSAIATGELQPAERDAAVEAAANRLWLALLEVERLLEGRRELGTRLRRYEERADDTDVAASA